MIFVVNHVHKKKTKERRKCIFNAELAKNYLFIQSAPNKTASDVRCTVSSAEFSTSQNSHSGRSDIEKHLTTEKHTKALKSKSGCQPLQFVKPIDFTTSANEGTWCYHVVKCNQSFRSTDCASKLFRECFGTKGFHCARTKTEAVVTNVFAPLAQKMLNDELAKSRYVTVTTDASNHGNTKMIPVFVRYFLPTVGVRVKMI